MPGTSELDGGCAGFVQTTMDKDMGHAGKRIGNKLTTRLRRALEMAAGFGYDGAALERWPSGLRRTLGKRVCVKAYPGFESLSLRQKPLFSAGFRGF